MGVWSRFKRTLRGGQHSAEIREELEFHRAMQTSAGEVARERLRLGNQTRVAEETRAAGIFEWLESAFQDAKYGFLQMRKAPAASAAIVLSIAIGVGANTAIFTLIDAALLKPLPVRDPGALRIVEWTSGGFPTGVENINGDFNLIAAGRAHGSSVSAALYRSLAAQQTSYSALMGAADPVDAAVAVGNAAAQQVSLQYVSANFFQGLGATPSVGRGFRTGDDCVGCDPAVIVSERFWRRSIGGAGDVLDRTMRVNNASVRIVGVAPSGFFGLKPGEWVDVYAPLAARAAFSPAFHGRENDRDWWVRMLARLRPEVSENRALAATEGLFAGLAAGAEDDRAKVPQLTSRPGNRGFGGLHREEKRALWILMLLVGVLLLMVCANVANLLLARSVYRQRESAVRLAIGAGRARLFRQHWIESAVLALAGGATGLVVGYALAKAIEFLFEAGRGPVVAFDLTIGLRILVYNAAVSMLTAFLFGLAPALRAASADLSDALKTQTRTVIGGHLRLPRMLVTLQIALCITALTAAGLLTRTLANLKNVDIGFEREHLAYVSANPLQAGYAQERLPGYMQRALEELSRIPGVIRVSPVEVLLLSGHGNVSFVVPPGQPAPAEHEFNWANAATQNRVGLGFFETMGIPLLAGRVFEPRDIRDDSDAVIVDETFAKRFFPNQNPVGRRFGFNARNLESHVIVGVVGATRYRSLRDDPPPNVFGPLTSKYRGAVNFAIRTSSHPELMGTAVRRALQAADPAVPLVAYRTQGELIDGLLRTERLLSFVSAAFGIVALTLAAIGLGGLLAYAVARRSNEIGVRMALGASGADVGTMVLRDSLWMLCGGLALGIPFAYAVGRVLKSSLYQLTPLDPLTAAAAVVALLGAAIAATWIPARRAARVDPLVALREE